MINADKIAAAGLLIMDVLDKSDLSELEAVVCVTGVAEMIYAQSPDLAKQRESIDAINVKASAEFNRLAEEFKVDDTKQHVL